MTGVNEEVRTDVGQVLMRTMSEDEPGIDKDRQGQGQAWPRTGKDWC